MSRYRTTWMIWCQIVMCLGLINTGCKEPETATGAYADYYFPIHNLPGEGKVYKYNSKLGDQYPPEIWKFTRVGPGRLESINYAPDGSEVLRQYDRIVSNGVLTDSLILMVNDQTGQRLPIRTKVVSPHRFPFAPEDTSKVFLTQLEWNQPLDGMHVVLQRRRQWEKDTTWTYQGSSLPAVLFKIDDILETETAGWTNSHWKGKEVYAKGLGLVYFKRNIAKDMTLEFELE